MAVNLGGSVAVYFCHVGGLCRRGEGPASKVREISGVKLLSAMFSICILSQDEVIPLGRELHDVRKFVKRSLRKDCEVSNCS